MRSVLLFGVVLASLQAAPLAYASGCETEYLPLAGIAGLPRAPAQTCILTSNGTNQKVRVTFLRINEVLAGNLIKKEPTPELDGLFTEASLYQNAISAQLADLFEKFGRKDVQVAEDTSFTVNVRAPSASGKQTWQSASLPLPAKEKGKQRRLWWMTTSFASSLFSEFGRFPIFIKSAAEEIAKTDQWPSGYQMDYDCNYDAIICTTLWTSLKLDQLAEIEKETAGEEKRVERAINESVGDDPEAGDEPSSGELRVTILERPYKSHFDLVRKLATNGLPENFLIASAGYGTPEAADGCDNSVELSFSYYMRPLTLDLAIFENLSDQPISGLSLAGRQFAQSGLHVDDDSAPGSAIDALPATLAARQKWIVPLRMAFSDIFDDWRDADTNSGQKMFKRISAKPAKSVFVSDVGIRGSKQGSVKKVKKAFLPPHRPARDGIHLRPGIETDWVLDRTRHASLQFECSQSSGTNELRGAC